LLSKPVAELEDHAFAEIQFVTGTTARIACSWRLAAGKDAVIEAAFYGTRGAAILRNVDGSFYNFSVEHCVGTNRKVIASDEGKWGGRATLAWVQALSRGARFNVEANQLYELSALIDAIYGCDQPSAA
jgi:predicted dehydrogenase